MLMDMNQQVKAVDIANFLSFSKPSVSVAIKQLKENGYIIVQKGGNISLTQKGDEIASDMCDRHIMLTKFLMALGVSEEIAKSDACKIEHYISKETYERIKDHCIPRMSNSK
jgi:Mn-dependent DtxR family transcriptional regulator